MRKRILIGLLPLLALLVAIGCYAIALFFRLGGAIDTILRENYASVVACQNMKESAERMDSALFFTLAGQSDLSRKMYDENLPIFNQNLDAEMHNITILPTEQILADKLNGLHQQYVQLVSRFLATTDLEQRRQMYFGQMLPLFTDIKNTAQAILELNQNNMILADHQARDQSARSIQYMVVAMILGLAGALGFVHLLLRSTLTPIHSLTASARELGDGNLDQVVPVVSDDELGQLADAFNKMAAEAARLPPGYQRRNPPGAPDDGDHLLRVPRPDHRVRCARRRSISKTPPPRSCCKSCASTTICPSKSPSRSSPCSRAATIISRPALPMRSACARMTRRHSSCRASSASAGTRARSSAAPRSCKM